MSAIVGKRIAIVGGGPGGLTLARLLQQSGSEVSVYERDQSCSARVQGSALDLHESSGLAALEAAGLIDAFWANNRPDLDRLRLTDAKGTVLHDHSRRMSGAGKRPEIERGPLRDLLLDSLQPGPQCASLTSPPAPPALQPRRQRRRLRGGQVRARDRAGPVRGGR